MKIIINLGRGNLQDGCHNVVVQLLDNYGRCLQQLNGDLPRAPKLASLYQQWKSSYLAFYQAKSLRISLIESEGMRYSEGDFKQVCQKFGQEFNNWLASNSFAAIEKNLRSNLAPKQSIQITVMAADLMLQQLPWHLWHFIDDYHNTEIAFSPLDWHAIKQSTPVRSQVRILAILGDSDGLDLQQDLQSLNALPNSELVILVEPQFRQLNEYLWQSQGWDILLFSGHSQTNRDTGIIYLNDSESITIAQLKNSLNIAIANGLQIAIFNSCAGMGLALQIAGLSLPYGVVMNEPVPDKIAQVFLEYFLTAFSGGRNFTLSVKEARYKLTGWETEYICASWLPIIWQNPSTGTLLWSDLHEVLPQKSFKLIRNAVLKSVLVSSLVMLGRSLTLFEPLELLAYDRHLRQRPAETIDDRILVVEITDRDSDRYPLSDESLVEAIDLLEQHQPAAIGIDLHRAQARGTSGYQELIESIESNPRLFPVCAYGNSSESYGPPQGLSETTLRQQVGFSDLLVDGDLKRSNNSSFAINSVLPTIPKVRRHLLSYDPDLASSTSKCLTPYSLSFQLAYEYLDQAGVKPLTVNSKQQWQFGDVTFQEISNKFGGYQQLASKSSQIALNYRAGQPGKRISLTQLRSGQIPSQLITNQIVLIGYTTSVARDNFETPYGTMPGVWIHAHMTSQLISAVEDGRTLIWSLPLWGDWLWILWWSILAIAIMLMLRKKPVLYSILALIILAIGMEQICILILIKGGWLPYVPSLLSLLLVSGVIFSSRKQHSLPNKSF